MEGGFYRLGQTEGFCAVECELRPCSRAEKARIRALRPLSSQYLIRNLGAGPWPGTDSDTLSRHSHFCSLSHTLSPTQGGQTEGRGHSLKSSTAGKCNNFTLVFMPCGSIKKVKEKGWGIGRGQQGGLILHCLWAMIPGC